MTLLCLKKNSKVFSIPQLENIAFEEKVLLKKHTEATGKQGIAKAKRVMKGSR